MPDMNSDLKCRVCNPETNTHWFTQSAVDELTAGLRATLEARTAAMHRVAAENERLREWRHRILDEGFGYDDSEESAAEVLEWAATWKAQESGTEADLRDLRRVFGNVLPYLPKDIREKVSRFLPEQEVQP